MRYILSRRGNFALAALVLALALTTSASPGPTEAQSGGLIAYGSAVTGTLTADAPLVFYSFQGHTDDRVTVEVLSLSGGLRPLVDLIAPDRQPLDSAQGDGLSFTAQDAHIALNLPQDGTYALMLGGADGTVGDFLLTLEGRTPTDPPPPALTYGVPETVTLSPEQPSQLYTFTAESCPTTLTLTNASVGEPFTFPFFAEVHDDQGREVARWHGGETYEDRVTVEPLSGDYEVLLWSDDPLLDGALTLTVTCADAAPACLENTVGGGAASACPDCPTCGDPTICADFHVQAVMHGDGVVTVLWPEVEGAQHAIISSVSESGELTYARMVEGVFSVNIDYAELGVTGGVQTIYVSVGAEGVGTLCEDSTTVDVQLGPVEWGPAFEDDAPPEECSIHLESPRDTIANGLQTFFWSAVPGAEAYELHISDSGDSLIATVGVDSHTTSVTFDTSEATIGAGSTFFVRIFALRGGEFWCADGASVERR